jgi:very-short-patch-repair endonuclease
MGYPNVQRSHSRVWELAKRQHGVVSRAQLLEAGYRPQSIKHRISKGRLHPVGRGVYAIGRPVLTLHGRWIAAVLSCGPDAALSHESAAALWGIRASGHRSIEVSVPMRARPRRWGIVVHRRGSLAGSDVTLHEGIPVTTPVCTLIDIAARLNSDQLEAAVNEADKLDLTDPERLRAALDRTTRRPGIRALRDLLDRPTFTLTDSQLERRFLALIRKAGLPAPETGCYVNAFKVDFHWAELGLVVETDGLRYHRTPAQQARDRIRDQAHTVAGLTTLRFTRSQVRFEAAHVVTTLSAVAARLRAGRP